MTMLIHVHGGLWVDPEAIAAVKWNSSALNEHPTIILRDGTRLEATGFTKSLTTETAESVTLRLLEHITSTRKAAAQAWGYGSRYPDTDPAATPEGEGSQT